MNKLFKRIFLALFAPVILRRGAIASSIGFFIGMLPLFNVKLPLVFLLSLIFRLNIFALLFGMAFPIFIPVFKSFSYLLAYSMEARSLSFDNIRYWLFSGIKGSLFKQPLFLAGKLIIGILFGLLLYPVFKWFYNLGISSQKEEKDFVFLDETRQRWKIIRRFGIGTLTVSLVIIYTFYVSMSNNPVFPDMHLKGLKEKGGITPIDENLSDQYLVQQLKERDNEISAYQADYKRHLMNGNKKDNQEIYAYYVNWDENSKTSLEHNINKINVVIPEWYHLNSNLTLQDESDPSITRLCQSNHVKVMPLINNFAGNQWDKEGLHKLLASPAQQDQLVGKLLNLAKAKGYAGINVDFEELDMIDQDKLTAFMSKLYNAFHKSHLKVTEDVPADDNSYDYGALSKVVDRMMVMAYDEHYAGGQQGPIASAGWFQKSLENLNIPSDKLIVSLGNYGYDWIDHSNQPAETLTFGDLMDMATNTNLKMHWDSKSGNPYVRYKDGSDTHTVWFLDAATFFNQMKMAMDNNAQGVALWRLGAEDPSVWKVLNNHIPPSHALHKFINPSPVRYTGDGEVLKIVSSSKEGERTIKTDSNGFITKENYELLPKPFEVERYGKPKGKEVVLTFDDGPDPTFTPKVLDILDRYHVKGAFFIVGENAELRPDLIERMFKSGDEIGSHTFTHPNVASISNFQTKMELNANQRLFQEITGHSMTMFRAPYVADAEPSSPNELLPILRAQEMGYTMIGELIDPEDWQRPTYQEIVKRVLNQLPNGNVILLHDAGGDRTNTIKALPIIIEDLKKRGYTFTTIGHLVGLKHDEIMPPATKDSGYLVYDKAVFLAMKNWRDGIAVMFYSAIIIGVLRLIGLVYLSMRQRKKYKDYSIDPSFVPHVSVIIAAYNEEKVINKTIKSILKSDYPSFDIIIVNDGSKDNTARVVSEEFREEPRVRLINKQNGGKSSAVNLGFKEATGEIIVTLDADTIIAEDAIKLLVRGFKDERVAAVSGNVKVGNVRNLLTIWQHIEYVTGFNLERRAFAELNCVTVVPGAIGAWRKSAVEEVGYFREDTLAEDTDITLSLLKKQYIISFEEKAYAFTEAPEDVKSLVKQRFRWTYGTLQCIWKHKNAILNKNQRSLGYIGLPNMWLFQYIYQSFSPIADLMFILALFGNHPIRAAVGFVIFYLVDFFAAIHAFRLEKESPKILVWLFLQRILYKQIMTYVVIKSILFAIIGKSVGWNKLKRNGNVDISQAQMNVNH